jgi:hypothetical protein
MQDDEATRTGLALVPLTSAGRATAATLIAGGVVG